MNSTKDFVALIKKAGKAQRSSEFLCPYIEDFFVEIAYASKFVLNQIREVSKEIHGNPRTGQREERLNDSKLRKEYAHHIIKDWKNLTPEKLNEILPGIDYPKADKNKAIPFDQEIAVALLESSLEFESWIIDIATEVKNFKYIAEKQEKIEENL